MGRAAGYGLGQGDYGYGFDVTPEAEIWVRVKERE